MINSLRIQNIVLIDQLEIRFHPGMQVLTGETGAGKSIVVDAVNLILGGRADRSLIRSGCDRAFVEAIFDVPENPEIAALLAREQIEFDGRTVPVSREITAGGRNLCRVAGVIVQVSVLKELGALLMDIHGQHEHQFLMNPDMHLRFLDRMGDAAFQSQAEKTASACEAFMAAHRRYARLRKENDQKQRRMAELEESLRQLQAARLKPGEEEQLRAETLRLRNAEKISSVLRLARDGLSISGTEESPLERVHAAAAALETLTAYDGNMKPLAERCESAFYELEEISFELSRLLEENDLDPGRLEKAEERLDLIRKLERRYGESVEAVLSEQARMEEEYARLCSLEDALEETAAEHKRLLSAYRQEARVLSDMRHALALDFEQRMMAQLQDLGMEKTRFQVAFQPQGEKKPMPRPVGDDQVEFMISPNPGEPLRPLAKIASGGELSRLMLAMKALEAEGSGLDCMVFDEIDTGISGRMAQVVAEKMIAISRSRQVICVTHLPQIAAGADFQFVVSKAEEEGRTRTTVQELDETGRAGEIARMISGAEGSGTDAEAYAQTMLEAAGRRKLC